MIINMSIKLPPPLASLEEWIRCADRHARHRLPLLAAAQRAISGAARATAEQRRDLAVRLERWRYQHLEEHRDQPSPLSRRLSDVLDLAVRQLLGAPALPPRGLRDALAHTVGNGEPIERAKAALNSRFSLETIAKKAAALTLGWDIADSLTPGDLSPGESSGERSASISDTKQMLLYAPIYLSSHCVNHCVYCGFQFQNQIQRRHLSVEEAVAQAEILIGRGFRHILLVAGDFPRLVNTDYLRAVTGELCLRGVRVSLEIAPQSQAVYADLAAAGTCGLTLYQETYNSDLYRLYHPRGTKAWYDWRLEGLERAAEAGIGRLGLGILLGLADPRKDLLALMRHGLYLQSRFPDHTLAFSLPRIHEAPEGFQSPYPVDDETFVRMYCALRLAFPRAELVLSTRESPALRNRLAEICITQMSAGSSTVPGGYEEGRCQNGPNGQFPIHDERSSAEVADWLKSRGFEVLW
jgi:2-iminoacetate synthase